MCAPRVFSLQTVMKRLSSLLPLVALAVAAPPAAHAQDRLALGVKLTSCATSAELDERAAAFTASMPADERGSDLALRFTLQQRDGSRWTRVPVPGWDRWHRADPGAAGLAYVKRIERLDAPTSYRVRVAFRWSSADGDVVRRAVRRSPTCRQPDLRPDLEPLKLTITPEGEGTARYTVGLRNAGRGDALRPFGVALSVAGAEQPRLELPDLEAGATGTLSWLAPACAPGDLVQVEVDDADDVDEADEDDAVLSRRC